MPLIPAPCAKWRCKCEKARDRNGKSAKRAHVRSHTIATPFINKKLWLNSKWQLFSVQFWTARLINNQNRIRLLVLLFFKNYSNWHLPRVVSVARIMSNKHSVTITIRLKFTISILSFSWNIMHTCFELFSLDLRQLTNLSREKISRISHFSWDNENVNSVFSIVAICIDQLEAY